MNRIILLCVGFIILNTHLNGINAPMEDRFAFPVENTDSLPTVLAKNHADLIESKLRLEAALKFGEHQLPDNLKDWEKQRLQLKNEIIKKAGVIIDHKLPLNIKETGTIQMKGYTVKNIAFQTRPGIYATANLYIPDGKGPFPSVINMVGHLSNKVFDLTHGYMAEDREAMLGWFDLHLKGTGTGAPKKEISFKQLPEERVLRKELIEYLPLWLIIWFIR